MQSSICKSSSSNSSSPSHSSINKKLILLVFSFFLLVNIVSSGGHFDTFDGTETFLVTESMVLKHSAKLYPDTPSIKKLGFDTNWSKGYNAGHQGLRFYDINLIPPLYTLHNHYFYLQSLSRFTTPNRLLSLSCNVVGLFVNSLIISLTSLVIFCFSIEVYRIQEDRISIRPDIRGVFLCLAI